MQTVKISLPSSWLDDVVSAREVHGSQPHPVWKRIANNIQNVNGRGSLVLDLTREELEEIILDAGFYSSGHYDADLERPYKYLLQKAQAKLAEL